MMINKRLIGAVPDSKRYIAGNVACQWVALAANIVMIGSIGVYFQRLFQAPQTASLVLTLGIALVAALIRFFCTKQAMRWSYLASKTVKKVLREKIYQKLLRLGPSYHTKVATSEVVQVSVEGVDQLETYFGSYLPQFFYSMLAPVTLFAVLAFVSLKAAVALVICVPLIPISIAAVQTFAKKLLSKYWGQYTALGDTFLENLQGLTTLKIYQSDGVKHQEMNQEAERFRKITMKVLTMQLNSITIMDLVAFGGAALGIVLAAGEFAKGNIGLAGCFSIILLSADFFLPMRQLGSFFHIAMNGMAASDKIFRLLDLPEREERTQELDPTACAIRCKDLCFSYDGDRQILHHIQLELPQGGFWALVGASGCGKSTLAALLSGSIEGYTGSITIGGKELSGLSEASLMKNITTVGTASYLFKGAVRENLLLGDPAASDEQLWQVLEQVKLADFVRSQQGLDTSLTERGGNLSGGQRQRLALARALLHDSPIYIFDEATSNIDVESENDIMALIHQLAKERTVLLISHRLANVVPAHRIFVLEQGRLVQEGTHEELAHGPGAYRNLWESQKQLEDFGKEGF